MPRKYFEDFELGERFKTGRQTVTEAEIVNFVNSNGWYDPLFIDMEHLKNATGLTQRMAPGAQIMAIAMGQWARLEFRQGAGLGMLGVQAKYFHPLHPGDTIGTVVEIASKKETSKPHRGVIDLKFTVTNQREEKVAEIVETVLFERRPTQQ